MAGRLNGSSPETIDISVDKLAEVVLLAHAYDAQADDIDADDAEAVDGEPQLAAEGRPDNAIGAELRQAIESMSEDEKAFLVALTWIGRGDFESDEFDSAIVTAFERNQGSTADYLMGMPMLGEFVEQGAAACGIPVSREEAERVYRLNGSG